MRYYGNIDAFCQKYNIAKELKINFLTGQFSVDLFSEEGRKLERVEDLKTLIYEKKGVAPHLQLFFLDRDELSKNVRLFELLSFGTLNLVVQPAKEIEVKLCLGGEGISLQMKETCTIFELKRRVGEHCGMNTEVFDIPLRDEEDDQTPIWLLKGRGLIIQRKVFFTLLQDDGNVLMEKVSHLILDEEENIENLIQRKIQIKYQFLCKGGFLLKNRELTLETKLRDVGETVIKFVVYPEAVNVCNIT